MVDFIAFDSCINQKYRSVNVFSSRHISTVIDNKVCLCSFAGTYCGVLPSDVETTLTLNADDTYLLIQAYKEKQNEREKLRGTFQVLDGNILMLVHPSSGDNIFYKVRDGNCIILIASFGNEPQKEVRKNYINIIIYSRNHTNYWHLLK